MLPRLLLAVCHFHPLSVLVPWQREDHEWEKWHFMIGIMDVYITNNDGIMVHERNCIYDSIQPIMIFGHMVICIIYIYVALYGYIAISENNLTATPL